MAKSNRFTPEFISALEAFKQSCEEMCLELEKISEHQKRPDVGKLLEDEEYHLSEFRYYLRYALEEAAALLKEIT